MRRSISDPTRSKSLRLIGSCVSVYLSIYLSIHRAALDSGCFFVGEGESPPKLINLFGLLNPEMRTSSTLPLSLTRLTLNYHLTTNNNNNRPRSSQDIGRHLESQAHRPPGTLRSPTHVEWTQDHGTTSRPAGALTTETLSWLLCVCICLCLRIYVAMWTAHIHILLPLRCRRVTRYGTRIRGTHCDCSTDRWILRLSVCVCDWRDRSFLERSVRPSIN